MARSSTNLAKGMQIQRPGLTKEPVPCLRAKSDDARQGCLDVAKPNRTDQRSQIAAKSAH